MSILVVGNQKGGVGKSTLAVLLAHWLAEKRHCSVCVVDLDAQCNSSKSLRSFGGQGEASALFSQEGICRAAQTEDLKSITLFRGSKCLTDVELARPEEVIPAFRRHVAALAASYDHVVIDTPPSLGLRMSAALIAADAVLCPIELEEYSIDGVTDMLKTIFGVRQRYNPRLRLAGIVANRFNPHSVRQRIALEELATHYSKYVIPGKISMRSALPEALSAGIPVWRLSKSSARDASAEVLRVFDLLWARMGNDLAISEEA